MSDFKISLKMAQLQSRNHFFHLNSFRADRLKGRYTGLLTGFPYNFQKITKKPLVIEGDERQLLDENAMPEYQVLYSEMHTHNLLSKKLILPLRGYNVQLGHYILKNWEQFQVIFPCDPLNDCPDFKHIVACYYLGYFHGEEGIGVFLHPAYVLAEKNILETHFKKEVQKGVSNLIKQFILTKVPDPTQLRELGRDDLPQHFLFQFRDFPEVSSQRIDSGGGKFYDGLGLDRNFLWGICHHLLYTGAIDIVLKNEDQKLLETPNISNFHNFIFIAKEGRKMIPHSIDNLNEFAMQFVDVAVREQKTINHLSPLYTCGKSFLCCQCGTTVIRDRATFVNPRSIGDVETLMSDPREPICEPCLYKGRLFYFI